MQAVPSIDLASLGILGILIGLFVGFLLGGINSISSTYRILLGLFLNIIGGLILSLLISYSIYPLNSLEILFIVLSLLGGFILGLFLNWKPYLHTSRTNHIIYDPDEDDEEFDRQIEEVLNGKE